jgi:hypothetical protein
MSKSSLPKFRFYLFSLLSTHFVNTNLFTQKSKEEKRNYFEICPILTIKENKYVEVP